MRTVFRHISLVILLLAMGTLPGYSSPRSVNPADLTIITLPDGTEPYISLVELSDMFNVDISYDPVTHTMSARRGGGVLSITNQSRIALYNGSGENMVYPARMVQGALFASARTFLPLFSRLIPGTIRWDNRTKTIDTSGVSYSITDLTYEHREGGTLVRIALSEPLQYTDSMAGEWIRLDIPDAFPAPGLLSGAMPSGQVRDVRLQQHDGRTTLMFRISDETGTYSITNSANPHHEIMLSLRSRRAPSDLSAVRESAAAITPPPSVPSDLWIIDTVVIDPGHGGKDPGTIGPSGTYEKDIVLQVSLELKKIIDERKEIKAVLTRDRDVFIPLKRRAAIADSANGKLFLSIHANGLNNARVYGMEAYFLSEAKTESAQRVADKENMVIEFEENPEAYNGNMDQLTRIMMGMASNVFMTESQSLCTMILDRAVTATKQKSRGVKQAGFYVMLGTQALMPSVLLEIGYLTNKNEEKKLKRISYQKRLAEAIYNAIIDFKRTVERDLPQGDT